MDVLLSVDLGTTACKAALYSVEGEPLGVAAKEYPLFNPAPGFVEQDADEWWSVTVETVRTALARSGLEPQRVCAISLSTQGISFVPVDREGNPLRHALCWLDTRATAEAAQIAQRIGEEELFQITGKRPSAAYVLPKLLWLRTHEPDLCRRTYKFLLAHDFLLFRLCGAALTDFSLASGSLLLDIRSLAWNDELLREFAIERGQLPELVQAGRQAGQLSSVAAAQLGLPTGIPVVVGGQDQKCAALGAAIRTGVATVSLGTASAISCLADRPVLDAERRIPTFPFVLPGYWDLEGVVGTAGGALRWARDTFFPHEDYSTLDKWAENTQPGAGGVRFFPHLAGATSPHWWSNARAAFTGLSLAAGRGEIVRSILEGVAFQVRANLEVVERLAPLEQVILFGGGANSQLWRRIIADVTAKPVRATHTVDVANWGACILAGLGAGLYADPAIARSRMMLSPTVEPSPAAVQEYERLYQDYLAEERRLLPNF